MESSGIVKLHAEVLMECVRSALSLIKLVETKWLGWWQGKSLIILLVYATTDFHKDGDEIRSKCGQSPSCSVTFSVILLEGTVSRRYQLPNEIEIQNFRGSNPVWHFKYLRLLDFHGYFNEFLGFSGCP
jgi:hypothetical protein